jgi:hypothetical protein
MRQYTQWVTTLTLLVWSLSVSATPIPIDLNDFFADPTVTVSVDGSQADFTEDPPFTSVVLVNDPSLGDPNVIIPGPGVAVEFSFDFNRPAGNVDEFSAFVIDAATGLSAGAAYEFFLGITTTGTHQIDISTLAGQTLGFRFALTSLPGDGGTDSTLTVLNVRLVTSNSVDAPATLALMFSGLAGLVGYGQRRCYLHPCSANRAG